MSLVTVNWRPTPKQMRIFGLSLIIGFGLIGWVGLYKFASDTPSFVMWAFAAVSGPIALLNLKIALPIYWVFTGVGFILGSIISRILLALTFYLVATPMGLLGRLIGRDRLSLKRTDAATYWLDVPPISGDAPYERQS